MSRLLQKIFKVFTYYLFSRIYPKIKEVIEVNSDKKIKVYTNELSNNIKYKIYEIFQGRLYTDRIHDTAIISDNKIIEGPSFQLRYEDSFIYNSKAKNNIVFQKGTPRLIKNLNGTVLSLLTGGGGNNNYFHWIFDVLPRINLCNKFFNIDEIDYFLFPNLTEKFQNETLDLLNIPINKRLSSAKFRHIKAKKLLVTDHPYAVTNDPATDMQNIPFWIVSWLKSSFLKNDKIFEKNKKSKIFINRKDSRHASERFISNENEVKNFLLKNNFKIVNLADINFSDQVKLFYNAQCVIGLHGGGFANTIFCKPSTKVIELKPQNAGKSLEHLAKINNLNYQSITVKAHEIVKSKYVSQQGSIEIPLSILKKKII